MQAAPYPSLAIRFRAFGVVGDVFALVVSGFEGHLAIPVSVASSLPDPSYLDRVRTASGEVVSVPVYRGMVELVDVPGAIAAQIIALGDAT